MNRWDRWIRNALIISAAAILIFTGGFTLGRSMEKADADKRGISQVPDNEQSFTDIAAYETRTVPGTSPRMLSPEYWIRSNSGRILFSPSEVSDFNRNNPLYVSYRDSVRNRNVKLFFDDLPETIDRSVVQDLIGIKGVKSFGSSKSKYFINGEEPSDSYWKDLVANCAYDAVPESVVPVYSVCLRRTEAYVVPSDDMASKDPDEIFINDFVNSELMPFSGVVALHESADKKWCFVIKGSCYGWVKKGDLASCRDKAEWLYAVDPDRFLIVTGSEVVMDETAVPTASSGMVLPMGTKIRLSSEIPETVNGTSSMGSYVVEIPCCKDDGALAWEQTLIPVSEDVHEGYLTMTSASVIKQAFKFLGRVYGWGGTLSSNDCSGMICQIYGCYGFRLPRNSKAIAELSDLGCSVCSSMTIPKKLEILEKIPAGQLLYMDGHLMLHLGMDEGKPYVISSCASYIDPQTSDQSVSNVYSVIVSNMELLRSNGRTWLEDLSIFQWKDY